jgi:DNA-binding response OmpR family regulator
MDPQHPAAAETAARPIRLLLVEDEFLIRLTLAEALADAGYEVMEAETADEALTLLQADDSIRLLLTDIQLPGRLDGLELVARARDGRPSLPVIYMTGRPDAMTQHLGSPWDAFIAKPYLPSEVTATVRRLTAG